MSGHIFLTSKKLEDAEFFKEVAGHAGFSFELIDGPHTLRRTLPDLYKKAVLVIDVEQTVDVPHYFAVASKYLQTRQTIAISSALKPPSQKFMSRCGHYWTRRTKMPAALLCSKLVQSTVQKEVFGIQSFFTPEVPFATIAIRRSAQKVAAVEAVHNHLTRVGVRGRLASLVAQSTDELLMNAIFDAPLSKSGVRSLHERPRGLDVELHPDEYVQLRVGTSSSYMAISVTDRYGSLQRSDLLHCMFTTNHERGEAMGLRAICQSGLTLLSTIHPKQSTEMTLLFPRVDNYRDFRSGPRFFSSIEINP